MRDLYEFLDVEDLADLHEILDIEAELSWKNRPKERSR